jgi:hypothetical protein
MAEMLPNTSFEADALGAAPFRWINQSLLAAATTFAVVDTWAAQGTKSLRFAGGQSVAGDGFPTIRAQVSATSTHFPATPGETYTVSATVNVTANAGRSVQLQLQFRDVNQANLTSPANVHATALGVTPLSLSGVAPAGTAFVRLALYQSTFNGEAWDWRVDACSLSNAPADTTPPAVPSGLAATPGDAQVALSWSANAESDLAGYKLYRGGVQVYSGTAATFTDFGVANGTTYSYTVSAYDTTGNASAQSTAVSATPVVGSSALWKADAESTMALEWASSSSIPGAASPPNPDATRIAQSTFRAQGLRSYRFEMRYGDDSWGARAELGQAMPGGPTVGGVNRWFYAGQERWIAMQYYLPTDWPTDNTWMAILQIKPTTVGGGGPNLGINAGNNKLVFSGNNNVWGSTAGDIFDGNGPLTNGAYALPKGKWIKTTWHIVFSADPAVGKLEVFGDLADGLGMRTLVPLRDRATMKYRTDGVTMDPAHLRVGIYRDPTITATASLYVDGITVASTRAGAEAAAYATQ